MRIVPWSAVAIVVALAGCGGGESSPTAQSAGETIEVRLSEFELGPARVSVDEPGMYVFRAVNDGETVHALEIEGHGVEEATGDIGPGETAEVTVELPEAGEYELYCPVGGHRDQGMEGSVVVGQGGAVGGGATTTTGEDEGGDDHGGGEYGRGG